MLSNGGCVEEICIIQRESRNYFRRIDHHNTKSVSSRKHLLPARIVLFSILKLPSTSYITSFENVSHCIALQRRKIGYVVIYPYFHKGFRHPWLAPQHPW